MAMPEYSEAEGMRIILLESADDGETWTPVLDPSSGGGSGATTLDELSDVDLSTPPTDAQVLAFDDADDRWKPATVAGGSGVGFAQLSRILTATLQANHLQVSDAGEDPGWGVVGARSFLLLNPPTSVSVPAGIAYLSINDSGLGIYRDPIIVYREQLDSDDLAEVESWYIAADATYDRIDAWGIHVTDWDAGEWEYMVFPGDPAVTEHPIQQVTISGSPTGGYYNVSFRNLTQFTVNYGDDQVAIQAAFDAAVGGGLGVITGDWESFTMEYLSDVNLPSDPYLYGAFVADPITDTLTGGVGVTGTGTRIQVGGNGTPIPAQARMDRARDNFFQLAFFLNPAGGTTWASTSQYEDVRSLASPDGLDASDLLVRDQRGIIGEISQGAGTIDMDGQQFLISFEGTTRWSYAEDEVQASGFFYAYFALPLGGLTVGDVAPIVVDCTTSLDADNYTAVFYPWAATDQVISPSWGVIGGAPFVGWWVMTSNQTFTLWDSSMTAVTTPLQPGDYFNVGNWSGGLTND